METKYRDTSTAVGVLLILLGLVFFVVTQGAFDLNWRTAWPFFPMVAGIFFLALAFLSPEPWRRSSLVLAGTVPLLVGLFFFSRSVGLVEDDMSRMWPVFPLIVGVAFFAAFLASEGRARYYLIPAGVLMLVALVFGAILWSGGSYSIIGQVWPVFLIIAGVLLLFTNLRRNTTDDIRRD